MAKMTIAQLREAEVMVLAKRKKGLSEKDSIDDFMDALDEAKHFLNRYYRLCGLSIRNFEDDNDERRCNTRWHKESEEKEERLRKKLDSDLFNVYGLNITYSGLYPAISVKEGHCIKEQVITGYFY